MSSYQSPVSYGSTIHTTSAVPAVLSLSLSEAVFGTAPLHEIPGTGDPIALPPVAVYCEQCYWHVLPQPHPYDEDLPWITFPCHNNACEECHAVISSYDHCSTCEQCFSCCACEHCGDCGEVISSYSDCSGSGYCSYCTRENHRSGSMVPGWIARGDKLPTESQPSRIKDLARSFDPVTAMADFYVSDWVAAVISQRYRANLQNRDNDAFAAPIALHAAATTLQSAIVAVAAPLFAEYGFAAIGGEIRHHPSVREHLSSSRTYAWDGWCSMRQTIPAAVLLADAVALFSDEGAWSAGYGGEAWAQCARVLHGYAAGAAGMDARTFVDRCFSLQHNGGSFLNKVSWLISSDGHYDTSWMVRIGEAHCCDDLASLLRYCSPAARSLVQRTIAAGMVPAALRDELSSHWDDEGNWIQQEQLSYWS